MRAKFIGDKSLHERDPGYYPEPGTIGEVTGFREGGGLKVYKIKWPKDALTKSCYYNKYYLANNLHILSGFDRKGK